LILNIFRVTLWVLVVAGGLAACGTVSGRGGGASEADGGAVASHTSTSRDLLSAGGVVVSGADAGPSVTIYVIKRSWHTDIGFGADDLHSPLASLRTALPGAHYLLFGFGDKHYLMTHANGFDRLVGAVWPGDGVVLLTGLEGTPEAAFGAKAVVRLTVSAVQAQALEHFVWQTLATQNGAAKSLAPGPYDGSLYYASSVRYSGLHTCNTWTAQGLQAAGLPVHTFAVEFSGQVWRQVQRIAAMPITGQTDAAQTGARRARD
jgi:hypothetical protein